MNVKITGRTASLIREASVVLGISAAKFVEQLARDHVAAELEASGIAFLFKRAMRQRYSTRDAAEATLERLNERMISESLEGNSKFLISAEVVKEDAAYRIRISARCVYSNGDSWRLLVPSK